MSKNSGEIPKSNEQCDESFEDLGENPPTVPIHSIQLMMLERIIEKQNEQEKFNQENQLKILEISESMRRQTEDQSKVLEKLESMKNQLDELKEQMNPVEEPVENITETVDNKSDQQEQEEIKPLPTKYFVLKYVFHDVSKMNLDDRKFTEDEYFGVAWLLDVGRKDDRLGINLHMYQFKERKNIKNWSIEVDHEIKIIHPNGNSVSTKIAHCFNENKDSGWPKIMKWDELKKDYLIDDELRVEVHVYIKKMSGMYNDNLRSFDETMKSVSDIVLVVNGQRFYVSKLYLATHSTYFNAMFLGMFGESKKSEITLTGIDADDFQKYLEELYGENSIDDYTLEGILLIADMYDTQIVIRKCEEYLINFSIMTEKKNLEIAVRYHLEDLKRKCLSKIKTMDDIRSVLPGNFRDMDPSIIADLLKKSLTF